MTEGISPHPDDAPFSSPLVENIFDDPNTGRDRDIRLQGLEDNPELVVRVEQLPSTTDPANKELASLRKSYEQDPKNKETQDPYFKALDSYAEIDKAVMYRSYLDTLASKYGIKNSGYMPVIGNDFQQEQPKRFIVTNKIEGPSSEHQLTQIPEAAALDTLRKLMHHIQDVYKHGGPIVPDLDISQFVYDPNDNQMVLIDHELDNLIVLQPHDEDNAGEALFRLENDLNDLQRIHGHNYADLRNELEHLFD